MWQKDTKWEIMKAMNGEYFVFSGRTETCVLNEPLPILNIRFAEIVLKIQNSEVNNV
jgi:hypothetical protein